MRYEWEARKARTNLEKHGVDFADAIGVFEDESAVTIPDPYTMDEPRWITVGMDTLGTLLVVVYTWRGDITRLISPRKTTPRERLQYEGGK